MSKIVARDIRATMGGVRKTSAPKETAKPKQVAKYRKTIKKRRSPASKTVAAKSARGKQCTMRIPGCQNDTATVSLCHFRELSGGGVGLKPDDTEAGYGCQYCHDVQEGRRACLHKFTECDKWQMIARSMAETHRFMRAAGILIFKGEQ